MIPLRDNIHLYTQPWITATLILGNFFCFLLIHFQPDSQITTSIFQIGTLVPADFWAAVHRHTLSLSSFLPFIGNLFIHAGWLHILSNMWYLWIFGRTSEACLGRGTFIFLYLLCGTGANFIQLLADPGSTHLLVGASGAISGMLGSYLICFPQARILVLIPLLLFFPLFEVPAIWFIGLWFFLQLQQLSAAATSQVAWWAHIGGFLVGLLWTLYFHKDR